MKDYKETRRYQEPIASWYFVAKKGYDSEKEEGLTLTEKDTWSKGRKIALFDTLNEALSKWNIAPKFREIYAHHSVSVNFECGTMKGFKGDHLNIKIR